MEGWVGLSTMSVNNLLKVITRQRYWWDSNPRPLSHWSEILPLRHRATGSVLFWGLESWDSVGDRSCLVSHTYITITDVFFFKIYLLIFTKLYSTTTSTALIRRSGISRIHRWSTYLRGSKARFVGRNLFSVIMTLYVNAIITALCISDAQMFRI